MAEASARMPLDILLRRDLGLALQQDAQGLQHERLGQDGGAGRAVERAALGVRMGQQMALPLTPMTAQPLFFTALTVAFISAVSPLLEMKMTTSPGTSWPQEPCTASVPCRK